MRHQARKLVELPVRIGPKQHVQKLRQAAVVYQHGGIDTAQLQQVGGAEGGQHSRGFGVGQPAHHGLHQARISTDKQVVAVVEHCKARFGTPLGEHAQLLAFIVAGHEAVAGIAPQGFEQAPHLPVFAHFGEGNLVEDIELARPGNVHGSNNQLAPQQGKQAATPPGAAAGETVGQGQVAGRLLKIAHGREVVPQLGFLEVAHQGGVVVGAKHQHRIVGHQGIGVDGYGGQRAPVIHVSGQCEQQEQRRE